MFKLSSVRSHAYGYAEYEIATQTWRYWNNIEYTFSVQVCMDAHKGESKHSVE